MRLTVDKFKDIALGLLEEVTDKSCVDKGLSEQIRKSAIADKSDQESIEKQRERVKKLREQCKKESCPGCKRLIEVSDYLVHKSVWALGGDGWAYDIGYGGLDHVLASGANVNALVLDTEVYSNTGGQMSKSTPRAAIAKFAAAGKPTPKKDLALLCVTYGNIYVARVAMGANPNQTVKAFIEAEAYPGPSIIIAYSHCIAHGYNLVKGYEHQKQAVESGYWPLYRYNPQLKEQGKNPLQLDSKPPSFSFEDYAYGENRYRALSKSQPDRAKKLLELAKKDVTEKFALVEQLSKIMYESNKDSS